MSSYISSIYKALFVLFFYCLNPAFSQTVDSSLYYKINRIEINGNKKTKDRIILRELIKKEKDTFLLTTISDLNKRGEFNIFNTQLFIYDSIKSKIDHSSKSIDYNIKVKERWYIWPIPVVTFLDRNINAWWPTKDLSRLSYGLNIFLNNFTGVKDRLTLMIKTGYANQFGFNYRLPYLNSRQTIGATVQYLYNEYNQLQYMTLYNKQQFTTNDQKHLRTDHTAQIGLFYRPYLFLQHSLDLNYANLKIADEVKDLNPDYFYKGSTTTAFFSLTYKLTYDTRDNKIYPLAGSVAEIVMIKDGFDISDDSKLNNAQIYFTYKKFIPLSRKVNLATMFRARYANTDQKLPFAFNQALGYSNFIRSYEYYVIDGQSYSLLKSSLRFQLLKPKFYEVDALHKMKPFSTVPFYAYLNLFYDAGYVGESIYTETNTLSNSWQQGYGISIDMITYYDLVIRLEYGINKQKESGFFIHFASGF